MFWGFEGLGPTPKVPAHPLETLRLMGFEVKRGLKSIRGFWGWAGPPEAAPSTPFPPAAFWPRGERHARSNVPPRSKQGISLLIFLDTATDLHPEIRGHRHISPVEQDTKVRP